LVETLLLILLSSCRTAEHSYCRATALPSRSTDIFSVAANAMVRPSIRPSHPTVDLITLLLAADLLCHQTPRS
jgi:hypothetical protein